MSAAIHLEIEKPVYSGDFLAYLPTTGGKPGKAVFVPLALPGETVSAHITEDKRNFAKAEIAAILTPSPHRFPPRCPHFGVCGGCHYQHADPTTQLALKQQILRETLLRAGLTQLPEIQTISAEPWAYRNRIRLAFFPDGRFGYRSRRSHDLIPIQECPIAAPILLRTAVQITKFFAETSPAFPISEIEIFTNQNESDLLITLFCESSPASDPAPWLAALQTALPAPSPRLRLQIFGCALEPNILAATGQPSLTYTAAGFPYRVHHGAFFQVNRHLLDRFVALVTANRAGEAAWDLYAGVGLFARQLAASFAQVTAVESAPASLAALRLNLAGTPAEAIASTTLDFLRRNREQRQPRPDLIVLDPPRAGLGSEVTTLLNQIHAPQIVYVSCDPATLARDLRALAQERYRIQRITLADMFPQTFHIETVVELTRS